MKALWPFIVFAAVFWCVVVPVGLLFVLPVDKRQKSLQNRNTFDILRSMETSKQIYDRYLEANTGDPLRAAHRLSLRWGVYHDNRDEYHDALTALLREAMLRRNQERGGWKVGQ